MIFILKRFDLMMHFLIVYVFDYFIDFQDRVRRLDKKLQAYLKVYSEKVGLTEEMINKLTEDMKSEWESKIITETHKTFIK